MSSFDDHYRMVNNIPPGNTAAKPQGMGKRDFIVIGAGVLLVGFGFLYNLRGGDTAAHDAVDPEPKDEPEKHEETPEEVRRKVMAEMGRKGGQKSKRKPSVKAAVASEKADDDGIQT